MGTNDVVDKCSGVYTAGEVAGTRVGIGIGMGAAAETKIGTAALGKIKDGIANRFFRYDSSGAWKAAKNTWEKGKHFHFDPTGTGRLMKHHLPSQLKE